MRDSRTCRQIILCLLLCPGIGFAASVGSSPRAQSTSFETSAPFLKTTIGLLTLAIVSFCIGALIVYALLRSRKQPQTQTETSLSEEGSFLSDVLQSTHDGFLGLSSDGHIVEVNIAYCRMSGYSRNELLGMHIRNLEAIDSYEEIQERIERVAREGNTFFETAHRKKNGEKFQVEISVTPVKVAPIAFIGFCRDISKRMQVESSLTHFSDLMRYVIEHTRSAIAIHDTNLNYLYVSQRYLTEYHITDPNIIGKHHYEVCPDIPQKWRDVHQRCLKGEVINADDDIFERADGSTEWTRWECRPWFAQDGEIGGIIVYTEVVTEHKKIELELRQTKDHLEKLINHANAPIVVWDAHQRITRFNHAFELLTGRNASEVLSTPIESLFPPDQRKAILDLMESTNHHQNPDSTEIDILHKNGSIRTVLWNSASIFDQDDCELIATIAQGQDITDRKSAENRVSEQLQELQRWYRVMLNRENRIIELKKEVNDLLSMLAQAPRYSRNTWENPT